MCCGRAPFKGVTITILIKDHSLKRRYDRLRERGCLTREEVAARLGLSEASITWRVQRGMLTMHDCNDGRGVLYDAPTEDSVRIKKYGPRIVASSEVMAEINRLLENNRPAEVAAILREQGLRTSCGRSFNSELVRYLAKVNDIPGYVDRLKQRGCLSVHELREQKGFNARALKQYLKAGSIRAHRIGGQGGGNVYEIVSELGNRSRVKDIESLMQ